MNADCRAFLARYEAEFVDFTTAAALVRDAVVDALQIGGLRVHTVEGRTKSLESLTRKLRRKDYADPVAECTDLVGIRVITLFRDDVDRAVEVLRAILDVDEANSVDRRHKLSTFEFGYRSVHLVGPIASVAGAILPDAVLPFSCELQVRSLLEHAWAETEHELVYKAGTTYAPRTQRKVAAVAGSLELMDLLFEELRSAFAGEVADFAAALEDGDSAWSEPLDSARVAAVMEVLTGRRSNWRDASPLTYPSHSAALVSEALQASGITMCDQLRTEYASEGFRTALLSFAALTGGTVDDVSHRAIAALMAGVQPGFAREDFPDLYSDVTLSQALEGDS